MQIFICPLFLKADKLQQDCTVSISQYKHLLITTEQDLSKITHEFEHLKIKYDGFVDSDKLRLETNSDFSVQIEPEMQCMAIQADLMHVASDTILTRNHTLCKR